MKKLLALLLSLSLLIPAVALAQLRPVQGGTGTAQIPTFGQVLLDIGANGIYTPVSTSTLGIAAASLINIEVLIGSGTWTPPSGVSSVEVDCTGSGASGATGNGTANWGSGGGAGATSKAFILNVGLISPVAYSVAPGGAAVSGTSLTGNNGTATTFGTFCTANGGTGGSTPGSSLGGVGGTTAGAVGAIKIPGGDGVSGGANANFKGANGGGSIYGTGGSFGVNGSAPGSGGGGNISNIISGAGANGTIVLYEYGNASGVGTTVAGTNGQVQFNNGGLLGANSRFFWDNTNKRLGLASTTPFAPLSLHALNGDTNLTLFAIGSSTQTATTTLFSVDNVGNTTQLASSTITGGIAAAGNQFRVSATNGGVGITGSFAASPLLTLRASADAGTVPCIEQILSSSGGTMFCIAENSGNNLGILSGITRIDGLASINLSHTGPPDSNANINLASSNMLIGVDTTSGTNTYIQSATNRTLLFNPTSNSTTGFSIGSVSEVGATISIGDPVNFPHLVSFQIASSTNTGTTTQFIVLNSGFTGISTSTPYAPLSIQSSANTIFVVATSTGNEIGGYDGDGHQFTSGPAPTISTCGTGTGTVVGDDQSGTITTATAATACTATFSKAYAKTPLCTVTDDSLVGFADISAISTTAVTFGISSALTGGHLYYSCTYHR